MGTTWEETIGSRAGVELHIVIETSTDGTTWEETNWGTRVSDWGVIEKQMEDWTGLFSVSEISFDIFDGDMEIYGSFTH